VFKLKTLKRKHKEKQWSTKIGLRHSACGSSLVARSLGSHAATLVTLEHFDYCHHLSFLTAVSMKIRLILKVQFSTFLLEDKKMRNDFQCDPNMDWEADF